MARRMFSDEITQADAFLDMPKGSQLLYFHLGIQADDDGFVASPRMCMRVLGASEDELKILYAKKFLIPFENGVCVVKHWRINNQIRKDRYRKTKYSREKSMLFIRENGSYSLNSMNALPVPEDHFSLDELPFGNHLATTRQPSIGKVSIGKVSIGKVRKEKVENSLSFLKAVPDEIALQLSNKYLISIKGIQSKADDLLLWCESNGKRKSNYKAFLENALRKDRADLQNKFPLEKRSEKKIEDAVVVSEDEQKKIDARKRAIKEGISKLVSNKKMV